MKRVTPPFKPVVESDESTSNFDPQFTSADIREVGFAEMDLDENDPSEDWTTQSMTSSFMHTPNGPLGSDRVGNTLHRLSQTAKRQVTPGFFLDLKGTNPKPQSIQVPKKKRKDFAVGTPLTNSVQENFRGFTFHGGESLIPSHLLKGNRAEDEEAVDNEDEQELNTDDEYADDRAAGRYANARRKGLKLDDEDMRI
jgi:serine/threonine protein kinase SCH9